MEVYKDSGKSYPPRTVYGIVCGLKRHLEDKKDDNSVLSTSKGETCKQQDEKPLSSLFNAAFHEGTFQNCNFHVVNIFFEVR